MLKYKAGNKQTKSAPDSTLPYFVLSFVRQKTAKLHQETALHFQHAFWWLHVTLLPSPNVTFTDQN